MYGAEGGLKEEIQVMIFLLEYPKQLTADINRLPYVEAVLGGSYSFNVFRPSAAVKVDLRMEKHEVPISSQDSDQHLDLRRNTS
jgi:hypothetical protein